MKTLTFLFLLFTLSANSQISNTFAINVQQGASMQNTRSYTSSLMIGIQSDNRTQMFIGGVVKSFPQIVGHKQIQYGLKAHVQTSIGDYGRITPFLEVTALKGEYYIYSNINKSEAFVKPATLIGGSMGVGYMFNDNIGLFVGYAVRDYNPLNYYKAKKSPYNTNAVSIKASYTLPLALNFNTSSIGQRRMW